MSHLDLFVNPTFIRTLMELQITSENKVVRAIGEGKAPKPALIAASKGMLPLPQLDLLEALVLLVKNEDSELSNNAKTTLSGQDVNQLRELTQSENIAPSVLDLSSATRHSFARTI